jgi:hypothetical protein
MSESYELIRDRLLGEASRGLLELADQSGGGSREAVAAQPGEMPDETAIGDDGSGWTVLGVWQYDEPIPMGAVLGDHWVHGGDDGAFPEGTWATYVVASDVCAAEVAAIEEVRSWNKRRADDEGGESHA